jgi:hypothetical protein
MTEAQVEDLAKFGFRKNVAERIVASRESMPVQGSNLWNLPRVSTETWKKVLGHVVANGVARYGAQIDTVVTTDIHRLIRLPNTLNGKTGFEACPVPIERLKEFDPFDDPIVISGEAKVRVDEAPLVRIHDKTYGPYNKEIVLLPLAAAVLFVSKGLAVPVEN